MTDSASFHPDVLVVGLGAMGSATVYQLARRGATVVGIDQFSPPHDLGSTHGETRITRQAIGEGEQFVPLALRSHQIWRELERATGRALLNQCGGLIVARGGHPSHMHEQSDFLGNTIRAARTFGIAHEVLGALAIAERFPQLMLTGDETAYYEPGAGFLLPESCVSAQFDLAVRHGATLNTHERVLAIRNERGRTVVDTARGTYSPGTTIVSAGAWLPALLPRISTALVVRRQVLYWFEVTADADYAVDQFPIFIWHWGSGPDDVFYGFPQVGAAAGLRAIKLATEQCDSATTPESVDRSVALEEMTAMFDRHIHGRMRGVTARCVKASTCLYTSAPRADFVIDRLPESPDLIVISACSGHGFKHSAAIGEAVAAMVQSGETPDVLRPFAFGAKPAR